MNKIKICILICGQKRGFDQVKKSFQENVINNLLKQNVEIDSFSHTDEPIELFNLKGKICKKKPELYKNFPILFLRFYECYNNLVKPYILKNNVKYDFFICTRPDLIYFENCLEEISMWDKNKINSRMRVYPNLLPLHYQTGYLDKGIETIDDTFFIIHNNLIEIAFTLDYGNYEIKSKNDWDEGKITKLWNSNNIKFKLLYLNAMTHNWRFDKDKKIYNKRLKYSRHRSLKFILRYGIEWRLR